MAYPEEYSIKLPRRTNGRVLSDVLSETAKSFFRVKREWYSLPQNNYVLNPEGAKRKPNKEVHVIELTGPYHLSKALGMFGICWVTSPLVVPPLISPLVLIYGGRHTIESERIDLTEDYEAVGFTRRSMFGDSSFKKHFEPLFEKYISEVARNLKPHL